jgi:hypothetical protein
MRRLNNHFVLLLNILPEEVQWVGGFNKNGEKQWHMERLCDTVNSDNLFS